MMESDVISENSQSSYWKSVSKDGDGRILICKNDFKTIKWINLSDNEESFLDKIRYFKESVSFYLITRSTDYCCKIKMKFIDMNKMMVTTTCFESYFREVQVKTFYEPDNLLIPSVSNYDFSGIWKCQDKWLKIVYVIEKIKGDKYKVTAVDEISDPPMIVKKCRLTKNKLKFSLFVKGKGWDSDIVMKLKKDGTAAVEMVSDEFWTRCQGENDLVAQYEIVPLDIARIWLKSFTEDLMISVKRNTSGKLILEYLSTMDGKNLAVFKSVVNEQSVCLEYESLYRGLPAKYYMTLQKNGRLMASHVFEIKLVNIDGISPDRFTGRWRFDCQGSEIIFCIRKSKSEKYRVKIILPDIKRKLRVSGLESKGDSLCFRCVDLATEIYTEHVIIEAEKGFLIDIITLHEVWVEKEE